MREIIKEKILDMNRECLYKKWTTKDGLNSFFSKDNDVELLPYGKFEIYFTIDENIVNRGSEGCRVLSFIPNKMFSFSWNTPPQFMDLRTSGYYTWVVLEFEEIDISKTLLRLSNLGYPDDISWDRAYQYFGKAWDYVLDSLEKSI